jgi:hypothetical protein
MFAASPGSESGSLSDLLLEFDASSSVLPPSKMMGKPSGRIDLPCSRKARCFSLSLDDGLKKRDTRVELDATFPARGMRGNDAGCCASSPLPWDVEGAISEAAVATASLLAGS